MVEMTIEQQRAVALASARLRLQQQGSNQSFQNDGTVGPTKWRQQVIGQDGSLSADNATRSFATGVPVIGGLLNKLDAITNATLSPVVDPLLPDSFQKLHGDTWSDRYNEALNIQEGKDKAFKRQHPYVDTGLNVAGGVAGTVPMIMAAPTAFGAGGGGLIGRSMWSAGTGGVIGGLDAGTRSDFDPNAMKWGAGAGLAMGLVGPAMGDLIGSGVRKARGAFTDRAAAKSAEMTPSAFAKLNRAATADGLNAASIASQLDDLGPNGMIMDLGPNLQRQAGALAAMPGEGQKIVHSAINARNAGANQRILSGLDEALGPTVTPSAIGGQITAGQKLVDYSEPFKHAKAVNTEAIANSLESAAVNRRGDTQKAAQQVRKMLNITGTDTLDPNPATLFETRQAIDGMLEGEVNSKVIGLLGDTRREIDKVLTDSVPGIKMSDAQFQELARQKDGLKSGLRALDSGREALRPEELQQAIIAGVNPEGLSIGPSAQTFRMKQAARADIDRQVGTKANDVVALKQVLKGDGDWNRDRIGMLFGRDRADRALNLLDREARFANTSNIVTRNSETAARSAAMQGLGADRAPKFGMREGYMSGGTLGAVRSSGVRLAEKVVGGLLGNKAAATNSSLANAISGNRQAVVDALIQAQLQRAALPPSQIDKIARALLMTGGLSGVRGSPGL